jgi:cellulose synthase operon protein C
LKFSRSGWWSFCSTGRSRGKPGNADGDARRTRRAVAVTLLLGAATLGAAELARELQHIDGANRLRGVFFRAATMPGGASQVRRPPRETRPDLDKLIAAAPQDADLYALRAKEAEAALDANAAEADWKQYAATASNKVAASTELAAFYHRRLRNDDELAALLAAGRVPASDGSRDERPASAAQWTAYEQASALVDAQLLGAGVAERVNKERIARFADAPRAYSLQFDFLVANKRWSEAEQLAASYARQFPNDEVRPITMRADLARARGSVAQALTVYEKAFRPLWPSELLQAYFGLIKETKTQRGFVESTRAATQSSPLDLAPASRLFTFYEQQGDRAAAQRALAEFRARKEARKSAWTTEELSTLGTLFERITAYEDAIRAYYALYSLPGAAAASQEQALGSIAETLLDTPEAPIRFGAGDLSLYKDVATMDRYPGALNGILSLLLNTTAPESEYDSEQTSSLSYFHRVRAAELVDLFDKRFAQSAKRPPLHEKLISAYAAMGESDAVIRTARKYLGDFPNAEGRTDVSLRLADAYARKRQTADEFAVYDATLRELLARAGGTTARRTEAAQARAAASYNSVLDRYVARLVALKRVKDALALYRGEIGRNPNDASLYERLAGFLEQNKLGAETEQLYQQAIKQFNDRGWWEKLARWYLREKRSEDFSRVTADVSKIFSGTDLEAYFADLVPRNLDAGLYRQVNLYAHQRFPNDLVFVRNLLASYGDKKTGDPAAWEALLRLYWTFDPALRNQFFEFLSRRGRLEAELAALRSMNPAAASGKWSELADANPAAAEMLAEGEAWRAVYEQAAPILLALHTEYPADASRARRASTVYRSLAAYNPKLLDTAVTVETDVVKAEPRNTEVMTYIGDVYADRERFNYSRPWWLRVPQVEPGKSEGYLETATVFWDYFQYDEALKQIGAARKKLANPVLFAYEAGAIYEGKRDWPHAISEYVNGSVSDEGNMEARGRLLVLAARSKFRDLVDAETSRLANRPEATDAAVDLRVAVLDAQSRKDEIERTLAAVVGRTSSRDVLARIDRTAAAYGLDAINRAVIDRQAALTADPVDRLRLRLDLARFDETHNNVAAAQSQFETIYRENTRILGVVRDTVDFHWRAHHADRAIAILREASSSAYPVLSIQFAVEAARKANEAAQYAKAREIAAPLLKAEPFKLDYLAAVADSYAAAGDYPALRQFYTAKLDELKAAGGSVAERNERAAALRRGLIPALTRLGDHSAAVDQYIELINRAPEDPGLVTEAGAYARAHGRQPQLVSYYEKTMAAAPKDYHWPATLARLQAQFENYEGAIESYKKAETIRPDRTDLLVAQGGLEERLMRFDDAAKTYSRIYDLSYRNPEWMVKVAEMRARLGQTDACVAALSKGFFEGRAETAADLAEVAQKLDGWDMVAQARPFAEKAFKADDGPQTMAVWARVLTRLREAPKVLPVVFKADRTYGVIEAVASVVNTYYTPEEKSAFAAALETARAGIEDAAINEKVLPLAGRAGLADIEARLLAQIGGDKMPRWVELQYSRLMAADVARRYEARFKTAKDASERSSAIFTAAQAYRAAGDAAGELRVLALDTEGRGRMYELLLRRDPKHLVVLAADKVDAAKTAMAGDNADTALAAVRAQAARHNALWGNAYTALTGYFFGRATPPIRDAFIAALGPATVGAQLAASGNRADALVGEVWFYYGARYGDLLTLGRQLGDPEDYLPSEVEGTPAQGDAYMRLAETYQRARQPDKAVVQYENVLQLAPQRIAPLDRTAALLYDKGDRNRALDLWKQEISLMTGRLRGRGSSEEISQEIPAMLRHLAERKLFDAFQGDITTLLKTYVNSNGWYRLEETMAPFVEAQSSPQAVAALYLDLSGVASDPLQFLLSALTSSTMANETKAALYARALPLAEAKVQKATGQPKNTARAEHLSLVMRRINWLLDTRQTAAAREALAALDADTRRYIGDQATRAELRAAAQSGSVDALLTRYATATDAPPLNLLVQTAQRIRDDGQEAAARRILEFAYTRELDGGDLAASNFLGLAEIKLQAGDATTALALLKRMALISPQPFESYVSAGDLLARSGRKAEAQEFYAARVRSTPWDYAAARALGDLDPEHNLDLLKKVAAAREPAYDIRTAVARILGRLHTGGATWGSTELNALASGGPIPADVAARAYVFEGRIVAAAEQAKAPAERVSLLRAAVATRPNDLRARELLVDAASAARQGSLALAAARPLLRDHSLPYEVDIAAESYSSEGRRWDLDDASRSFLTGTDLTAPARAGSARAIADTFRAANRLQPAQLYFNIAARLSPPGAVRQQNDKLAEAMSAERERRAANQSRMPAISDGLEQANLVLPRIPPPGSAASRPQGGVQ